MTDDQPNARIEINLPGEDPKPPEYQKMVDFGETFRQEFSEYRWELGMLAGTSGETIEIPALASCIESAFRIHVAGVLSEADFPEEVYDAPDVAGDLVLTDQDLGKEEIAVTVTSTPRDGSSHQVPDEQFGQVDEHWHINLTYDLSEQGITTSEKVSNTAITISKL